MTEYTIKITPRDDGGFRTTMDSAGISTGGGAADPHALVDWLERQVEIIVDRESGGSGLI